MRNARRSRLAAVVTAGIAAPALVLSVASAFAQAAPAHYRQLDGSGLISVLPGVTEAPAWFGKSTQADTNSAVPTQGLLICTVGTGALQESDEQTEIRGPQAQLAAYSFVNFGRFPSGGYSNMISRISQFPSAADATKAWASLVVASRKCSGSWSLPYPATNDTFDGRQAVRQTVSAGDALFGSRSLVITSVSSGTRNGAAAPDRTGGSLTVWRHLGNVIYHVEYTKVVQRDVSSAISVADRMTIATLSALTGERYISIAAG